MNTKRYISALAVSSALALALVGCTDGSSGEPEDGQSSPTTQGASPSDTANDGMSSDPQSSDGGGSSDTDGQQPSLGGTMEVALTAISTAEADGGTVIEIDHDDSGLWEIDVVNGDTVSEINVSADGATVVGTDDTEPLSGSDKTQVSEAKVALSDALKTAFDNVPGTLDEAELTSHKGKTAFEVEIFSDGQNTKKNVYVDAVSGEFLETTPG